MAIMKAGTRIETKGFALDGAVVWERAKIARVTARMLPLPDGYCPVRFDVDGGVLLVHASQIRVTDNRP